MELVRTGSSDSCFCYIPCDFQVHECLRASLFSAVKWVPLTQTKKKKNCGLYSIAYEGCSLTVLVDSGCHNKVPWTGWLTNSIHLFLMVLESRSLRSGVKVIRFR